MSNNLHALVAALSHLPKLREVESAELFDVESRALAVSIGSGYLKTALFIIAFSFDRLARRADGDELKPGHAYAAICAKAIHALSVDQWTVGASTLDELVDLCWTPQIVH
jgi:hypothetical protein